MHALQKLPTKAQFLSEKPVRVTTVPNLDYGSTEKFLFLPTAD